MSPLSSGGGLTGPPVDKVAQHRSDVRRRLVLAARISLARGGGVTDRLVADICGQAGTHPYAFRQLFPTADDLLDAVTDLLVVECASRLRAGVDAFVAPATGSPFEAAAVALAEAWPLDRGGLVIRAERRLRVLRTDDGSDPVLAAERRFVGELGDVLDDLMARLGRTFAWPSRLAVRVILDTFERSFEAWILRGNPEAAFPSSPFVRRTLPTILEELTRPADDRHNGAWRTL